MAAGGCLFGVAVAILQVDKGKPVLPQQVLPFGKGREIAVALGVGLQTFPQDADLRLAAQCRQIAVPVTDAIGRRLQERVAQRKIRNRRALEREEIAQHAVQVERLRIEARKVAHGAAVDGARPVRHHLGRRKTAAKQLNKARFDGNTETGDVAQHVGQEGSEQDLVAQALFRRQQQALAAHRRPRRIARQVERIMDLGLGAGTVTGGVPAPALRQVTCRKIGLGGGDAGAGAVVGIAKGLGTGHDFAQTVARFSLVEQGAGAMKTDIEVVRRQSHGLVEKDQSGGVVPLRRQDGTQGFPQRLFGRLLVQHGFQDIDRFAETRLFAQGFGIGLDGDDVVAALGDEVGVELLGQVPHRQSEGQSRQLGGNVERLWIFGQGMLPGVERTSQVARGFESEGAVRPVVRG